MIFTIFILGLILRILAITRRDFWLDEALTYHFANLPLPQMFTAVLSDNNPPLHYLVIHFILKFTRGEFFLRLPSLIANLASILLLYKFLKNQFNLKTALIASGLFAFSPLSIYVSTEARLHSLASFLLIAQITIFYYLIKNPSLKTKILFIAISTISLYSHYYLTLLFLPFSLIVINFRGLRALGIALQVYMSEQNISLTRKYVFALAFIRGLIVHGVLRANIKKRSKIINISFFTLLLAPAILFAPWLYLSTTFAHNGCWCPSTLIALPATLASNSINGVGIISSRTFLTLPLSTIILFTITSLAIFFYFLKGVFKNPQFSTLYLLPITILSLSGLFIPVFSPKAYSIYSPIFFTLTALGLNSKKMIVSITIFLALIAISIIQLDSTFQGEKLKTIASLVETSTNYPVYHTSVLTYYSLKYYIPQTQHFLITSNPLNYTTTSYIGGQKQALPENTQKFWLIDSFKWSPQTERNQILSEIKGRYKAESMTQKDNIATYLFSK